MPDAKPEWYPVGEGHYERVCTCGKEVAYPPMWQRPDILDPAVMQHEANCSIADKPEMLKVAVKVKKESTYDFATCGVCSRNWSRATSHRRALTRQSHDFRRHSQGWRVGVGRSNGWPSRFGGDSGRESLWFDFRRSTEASVESSAQ